MQFPVSAVYGVPQCGGRCHLGMGAKKSICIETDPFDANNCMLILAHLISSAVNTIVFIQADRIASFSKASYQCWKSIHTRRVCLPARRAQIPALDARS